MEMNEHIAELLDILKREIKSFETISELLILEEKSLVEFNTKDLAENLERQGDVFSSIACLEKSRLEVLDRISELTGNDLENLTIERLSSMIDDSLRKKLVEAGHVLKTIHEDVKKRKTTNAMLIKQGVMLVESDIRVILNAIGNPEMKETGYSANAETDLPSGSVCIDGRM